MIYGQNNITIIFKNIEFKQINLGTKSVSCLLSMAYDLLEFGMQFDIIKIEFNNFIFF